LAASFISALFQQRRQPRTLRSDLRPRWSILHRLDLPVGLISSFDCRGLRAIVWRLWLRCCDRNVRSRGSMSSDSSRSAGSRHAICERRVCPIVSHSSKTGMPERLHRRLSTPSGTSSRTRQGSSRTSREPLVLFDVPSCSECHSRSAPLRIGRRSMGHSRAAVTAGTDRSGARRDGRL
jgi:hypothetical protein